MTAIASNGPSTRTSRAEGPEIAVLSRQCLGQRIPDLETLRAEVAAWEAERNRTATRIDWRFTAQDARIKLKRLYPVSS